MAVLLESIELHGLRISATLRITNTSQTAWRASEGFTWGYQIFDPPSEMLLIDGERFPVPEGIAPQQSVLLPVTFDLPGEAGAYRIFVSGLFEGQSWFYERGEEFLLVDASVSPAGEAVMERARVTNSRAIRTERWIRGLGRVFTLPPRTIWNNRSLIHSMVKRDILGRYRGSFGGWFWTVLNPLLLALTYFFVFGVVMKARFGNDPSKAGFALYFLAGMLPWLAFSEAVGRAPVNMLEHRTFIKKLRFPVETLPFNLVLAGLVSELFGLAVYCLGFLLARGMIPVTVLWLPVLVIPQILFTAGLCWFLAALGVFVRDLAQVNGFLLTLWFFLTPICYSESGMPSEARALLTKNPLYVLVKGYRSIFLEHQAPAFGPLWKLWVLSTIVFFLGYAWFHRLRKTFADVI